MDEIGLEVVPVSKYRHWKAQRWGGKDIATLNTNCLSNSLLTWSNWQQTTGTYTATTLGFTVCDPFHSSHMASVSKAVVGMSLEVLEGGTQQATSLVLQVPPSLLFHTLGISCVFHVHCPSSPVASSFPYAQSEQGAGNATLQNACYSWYSNNWIKHFELLKLTLFCQGGKWTNYFVTHGPLFANTVYSFGETTSSNRIKAYIYLFSMILYSEVMFPTTRFSSKGDYGCYSI